MPDIYKQAIRKSLQGVRKNLPPSFQQKASSKICANIRGLKAYRDAKQIALYHSFKGEVDLGKIWETAPLHGKYCYFPALTNEKTLLFLPATPTTPFCINHYGIKEPDVSCHQAKSPTKSTLFLCQFLDLISGAHA